MNLLKSIWQCLYTPRLYKVYGDGPRDSLYQPMGLEKIGDKIITSANTIMNIGIYTSPFICIYVYKRAFFSLDETHALARFFGAVGCFIAISFILRAYGRANSRKYMDFLQALRSNSSDVNTYLNGIRQYDFDFEAWPITFKEPVVSSSNQLFKYPFLRSPNSHLPMYQKLVVQGLSFIAINTFALRLIYPGSLSIVQNLLWMPLFQGRALLVEAYNGKRTKIGTSDGNSIDTMFVDSRSEGVKGNTLVICCEGNSGFYEIGIMMTPIKAGYSALGWNHPGFAGSTGTPYPRQEHNAIDAVMQFAIQELGFKPENIVMYGWSIGGYPALWAATRYPSVKGVVLDATFDDLLPLAENQMPSSWCLLVKEVIRSFVDLNISELVKQYDGPLQLIRRTEDEIICTRQGRLSTNRGNFLVADVIAHRHADDVDADVQPEAKTNLMKFLALSESQRTSLNAKQLSDNDKTLLRLISQYMHDYRSSHCTPLPEEHFVAVMDKIIPGKRG